MLNHFVVIDNRYLRNMNMIEVGGAECMHDLNYCYLICFVI